MRISDWSSDVCSSDLLAKFMRPTRRHVAMSMRFGSARIEYQPLGVIGIVSPWNYPFALAMMPLVTAIAAGKRVMFKPSEITPASARSEEHTSELQSLMSISYDVFCLKKQNGNSIQLD